MPRRRRGIYATVAALLLCAAVAGTALASATVTVKRCGYVAKAFYGRDAIYPWHMSCAQARTVAVLASNPHVRTIQLTADGAATANADPVLIHGKWWVCGGQMGSYFCGYPYRPTRVPAADGGGTSRKGPFTKVADDNACSLSGVPCGRTTGVWLPSGASD